MQGFMQVDIIKLDILERLTLEQAGYVIEDNGDEYTIKWEGC